MHVHRRVLLSGDRSFLQQRVHQVALDELGVQHLVGGSAGDKVESHDGPEVLL
jgi:hypothetical protein